MRWSVPSLQLVTVVQLFASQQTADDSCAALCKPTDSSWQLCSSLQANRQLMTVVQLFANQQTADDSCAALCKPTDS
jgi:predicted solute-binding protein